MMKKLFILPAVIITAAVITGSCVGSNVGITETPSPLITITATTTPSDLPAKEILEYEGENLSSISSFRENSIKGPQYVDTERYTLEITGLVATPSANTYEEITTNNTAYKKLVTLHCVEGWSAKILWEGFLLRDIIEKASPTDEAVTVIFHAYDGYTTSFPLSYVMDNDIIMAYKMNDILLPPERGYPFQLVAESKWGYKWIKWITKIELSSDTGYRGYWESRGYADEGNLNEGFFD